jgi:hypothetical protein
MAYIYFEPYRQYKLAVASVTSSLRQELESSNLRYQIIRSNFDDAWMIVQLIHSRLFKNKNASIQDRENIGKLRQILIEFRFRAN